MTAPSHPAPPLRPASGPPVGPHRGRTGGPSLAARLVLLAAALVAAVLVATRIGFVPVWDGRIYADCAVDAALHRLAPYYLRCYGHASHAYTGLLALSQLLDPGNHVAILVVNALLFAATCVGFHRLLHLAAPGEGHALDRALVTAAFALQPAFLAMVVQPGTDFPVLAGFLWCTVLLLERRWWWAATVGTATVFSKETGVLVYGVLLATYAAWTAVKGSDRLEARLRRLVPAAPALLPLAVFAGYVLAYAIFRPGSPAIYAGDTASTLGDLLVARFLIPRLDRALLSHLALIFVLNFAWVVAAVIAAALVVAAVRRMRRQSMIDDVAGAGHGVAGFVALLTAVMLYAITRHVPFSNVRYVAVACALVLASFYLALLVVRIPAPARRTIVGAYLAALVVSSVRTVDPISRLAFGTFPVGEQRMLRMTGITGECCAYGLDQLVYSLEFTRLHELTDDALAAIAPGDSTLLIVPHRTEWYTIGPLDARTHRRTLRRAATVRPTEVEHVVLTRGTVRPRTAWYLALPNADHDSARRELATVYELGPERRFERDGYVLSVYALRLIEEQRQGRPEPRRE